MIDKERAHVQEEKSMPRQRNKSPKFVSIIEILNWDEPVFYNLDDPVL
jgi:hypothetical protein